MKLWLTVVQDEFLHTLGWGNSESRGCSPKQGRKREDVLQSTSLLCPKELFFQPNSQQSWYKAGSVFRVTIPVSCPSWCLWSVPIPMPILFLGITPELSTWLLHLNSRKSSFPLNRGLRLECGSIFSLCLWKILGRIPSKHP